MPIVQRFISAYKLWHSYRSSIPKQSRFTLGAKIDTLFIDTLELFYIASYLGKEEKLIALQKTNTKLDVLKFFLQISWELSVFDTKKYAELSQSLEEIGRMLGGWKRGLESKLSPPKG